MKVLVYGNRKQDDEIYDISTPEKEAAAYLKLFNFLDEEWRVYETGLNSKQKIWYERAKGRDSDAAKKLLFARKDFEYEEFHFGEVINPLCAELDNG